MNSEDIEIRLRNLDGRLETGGIGLEDYLKGLYDLIGQVLATKDDDLIVTLAIHLRPAVPWSDGR